MNRSGLVSIAKGVVTDFSEKNVSFMAAGIAYRALVSLAPLLILLLLLVTFVGGGLEARLLAVAENRLPGPIADVVTTILQDGSGAAGASVIGFVVLLWGTLKIFRGLDTAFSEIYETDGQNSIVDQLVDGVVVLTALFVSLAALIAVTAVLSAFSDTIPYLEVLTPLVLVLGLIAAFFPMYYRFPDTDLGWRDVLPGTVFAAVGWALLQTGFQIYLTFSGGGSGGFLGGVLVVVTWLYFSGLVLLLGAVLNAVIGGHSMGESGGVGRAAGGGDDADARTLDPDELSSYLRDLRAQLTGYHEELERTTEMGTDYRLVEGVAVTEVDGTLQKVRPLTDSAATVEVVERSHGRQREVTFRWRPSRGGEDGARGAEPTPPD